MKEKSKDIGTFYIEPEILHWLFTYSPSIWCETSLREAYRKYGADVEKVFTEEKAQYIPHHIMRDLYRFLSGNVGQLNIHEGNYWAYKLVFSNPSFRELCLLTEGRHIPAKIVAQILAAQWLVRGVYKHLKHLPSPVLSQEIDKSSIEAALAEREGTNNSNSLSKTDLSRIEIITQAVEKSCEEAKETIKKLSEAGLCGGFSWSGGYEAIKVSIPSRCFHKIQKVIKSIYGAHLADEYNLTLTSIPDPVDPILEEPILTDLKTLEKGFMGREKRSRLNFDIYLDSSGSMDDYIQFGSENVKKFQVALGVIQTILKMGIRVEKIFAFANEVKQIQIKNLNQLSPSGGTSFRKVLESISKRKKSSVIISDMQAGEYDLDVKEFKTVKPMCYYIQIGSEKFPEWINEIFKEVYRL